MWSFFETFYSTLSHWMTLYRMLKSNSQAASIAQHLAVFKLWNLPLWQNSLRQNLWDYATQSVRIAVTSVPMSVSYDIPRGAASCWHTQHEDEPTHHHQKPQSLLKSKGISSRHKGLDVRQPEVKQFFVFSLNKEPRSFVSSRGNLWANCSRIELNSAHSLKDWRKFDNAKNWPEDSWEAL